MSEQSEPLQEKKKEPKLLPEIKAAWLTALRSGKYTQTRGRLRRTIKGYEGYCCLGVLCDVHSQQTNMKWDHIDYDGRMDTLSEDVRAWAGLGEYLDSGQKIAELIHLNDREKKDFDFIADFIEENL